MEAYLTALTTLLQPMNFFMMFLCAVIGCVLGAIPGLSGGLGITLILPMTFALNTELSFAMLLGMYVGGVSGSFIAAVLVGIPGSAASIGTCFDGHPMTQNGKAAKALSIGIIGSFIGTAASIIVAMLCSGFIANIALLLGPWEYFSLCLMAITMVIGLSNGSIYKGLMAAFIGLWFSTVGSDLVTNQLRFTFGNTNLYGGINMVCMLMGTFALQQMATSYAKGQQEMPEVDSSSLGGFGLTLEDDDLYCARVAAGIHGIVVDVDYATSDKNPFPAAYDQSYAVVKWAFEQCSEWDADPKRVSAGGHSAGGCLVAAVSMRVARAGEFTLCMQMLDYAANDNYMPLVTEGMERSKAFSLLYADGDAELLKSPEVSPVFAALEDLKNQPYTLIVEAGQCPFVDANRTYEQKLLQAGNQVKRIAFPNSRHGFSVRMLDEWREAQQAIVDAINTCPAVK